MLTIDGINCTLDFERDGKQFGNIEAGFSDNRHAFAKIPVPVVCIKKGSGPTLLLCAGNHGDGYEGQVILRRLIHRLAADNVQGRLILLPALNHPAMLDDARVSPLDQGNMNRSFPGIEGGPPTAATAIGWRGVPNVTRHPGIVDGEPEAGEPTRVVTGIDSSGYLSAPDSGIFEPSRELGETVAAGQTAGLLYSAEEVERGDHLFTVASEMGRDDVRARPEFRFGNDRALKPGSR
jgi:predicted deacylase